MAYPPGYENRPLNESVPIRTETIPPGATPLSFAHNDLHEGNVGIGELEPGSDEHSICPIIKVRVPCQGEGEKAA